MKPVFIVFISERSWLRYGRKPHYSELSRFSELIVVEEPLKIFSKEFISKPFKAISNYFRFSKGIRNDKKYNGQVPVYLDTNTFD